MKRLWESRAAFACLTLVPAQLVDWWCCFCCCYPLLIKEFNFLHFPTWTKDPWLTRNPPGLWMGLLRHPASWSEQILRPQLLLCDNSHYWSVQPTVYKITTNPFVIYGQFICSFPLENPDKYSVQGVSNKGPTWHCWKWTIQVLCQAS